MSTHRDDAEHHEVVIVGAGQAGLSMSWFLCRAGVDHVLLERDSVGSDWKTRRWDNFTLVTPNWQCQLPGFPYAGSAPHGFMQRDEVHTFIQDYAASFGAPVRTGVTVTEILPINDGGYQIATSEGTMTAGQVVVATGGYHKPSMPRASYEISRDIYQIHSADYRNPDSLPDGSVLVVGSGQSGAQIAEDLHLGGRHVHLAVGSAPRVARFYRGRDCVAWLHDMGTYDVPVENQSGGLTKREKTNHYVTGRDGGRDIDLRRFALEGMELYGRLDQVNGYALTFQPTLETALDGADSVAESIKDLIDRYIEKEGLEAPMEPRYTPVWRPEIETTSINLKNLGITSIVWAVGFETDYSWIKVPVFDGGGHPSHRRGITDAPGLHFLGLPWLHTWGSGRFAAIARDAEYLSQTIIGQVAEKSEGQTTELAAQRVSA